MKAALLLATAPILIVLSGSVQAQGSCSCGPGSRVQPAATVATLLGGKTACAMVGTERWQEFHQGNTTAGGNLIDYKRGPGHPTDPTATVGTWSTSGTGSSSRVIYNYGSGGVYSYEVCQNGATIRFCGTPYGGRDIAGSLVAGQVACP